MGAVHVTQARGLITLVTLMVVGVQLAMFTQWRFAGVVVMLVWLWPVAVGLTGLTSLALFVGSGRRASSSTRTAPPPLG